MKNKKLIISDKEYQETMVAAFQLMNKGEDNLTAEEALILRSMALRCEKYENEYLNLKPAK